MASSAPQSSRLVVATSSHGVKCEIELRINEWNESQRAARAWKRLGLWWLAAVFAAIVPPHIPWFAIAFIGGPIAAMRAGRARALIQTQTVACPDCGTQATIEEQPESWPLGARCSPCQSVFWIEPRIAARSDGRSG